MATTVAIEVSNLSKSFKGKTAIKNVYCSINEGEMVALIGASGSGKSTLLRHINGLHIGDAGTVYIFGTVLQSKGKVHSKITSLRSQIGCIFQQFNLVNRLTVIENVLVGKLARLSILRSILRLFSKEEKAQALSALERVGIIEHAYKRASKLSGGQQQRVAIARCLVQGAKIILADEPIASLDPESARKVMELLVQLNRQSGITVVASLHQIQMVRSYFDRAIALRDGEVMFDGATVELDDKKLNEIYGTAAEELVMRGHGELLV
ncbi:phosphonate ABC transporter ATP-binding protein [Anabaena sp. FACHB-709]|uniref:Phosphonates import ATP-binding protein PhnC 1 n=3 Tax=Nostocaceae TaxID=1162 RepID=PHNC1_NOSS1|nr:MULTISPECIES: phosphonate ABC transporter ATP-binding protein [Nostocaceae]Q8YUV1.1 RecName: Full=Phosphonates import ATP-binding protein PhnC 1 [Nostoc sp. PCC 7120 = FACHB-418]BAY67854.1 phosphonate ABC transporter ATP-binding protein [Trichormus variabilis NIES-23]HBW29604.1 phosphonate ABC transporter ATP-binding protein [Nostoc sp. UBA8866]MBD2170054.1 phosphonate ABC transporter ATP-binding protein [Anabaena cylindrica FACHB-318]MBD2261525.1 phosphonate ABC transporter ATP-binding pro